MSVFFKNYIDASYGMFCRFYGLDLSKVRVLEALFNKQVKVEKGEHLVLQFQQMQAVTYPETVKDWLSAESYFVDWQNSSLLQNLNLIETILRQSLRDLQTPDQPLINPDFYKNNPIESQFVHRVLSRKIHDMKQQTPEEKDSDLFQRSILSLIQALELDKQERITNPDARLNFFTKCNYAQSQLLNSCGKTLSVQVGTALVLLVFMKARSFL